MRAIATALPEVLILEPKVFGDERGFFMESFNARTFAQVTGVQATFVQDNHSRSARHVLRGFHYQLPPAAQDKLVRVVAGAVRDVAVDLRRGSATFGHHVAVELSAENRRQLWIPRGFAHAFLSLADGTEVEYKVTDFYAPAHEHCLRWDQLGVDWGVASPVLSAKDAAGLALRDAPVFP